MRIMAATSKGRGREAPPGTKRMRYPITPAARRRIELTRGVFGWNTWEAIDKGMEMFVRAANLEDRVREIVELAGPPAEEHTPLPGGPVCSGGLSSTQSVESARGSQSPDRRDVNRRGECVTSPSIVPIRGNQ
jgi:hypothetical protein